MPGLCFHHPGIYSILTKCRGPEVESWFGVESDSDPAIDNDWSFLPFMALSDGAHAYAFPVSEVV